MDQISSKASLWCECIHLSHLSVCNTRLSASCGHSMAVQWGLALREVLKDEAEVPQAVFK